jgi:hypothetical protein
MGERHPVGVMHAPSRQVRQLDDEVVGDPAELEVPRSHAEAEHGQEVGNGRHGGECGRGRGRRPPDNGESLAALDITSTSSRADRARGS